MRDGGQTVRGTVTGISYISDSSASDSAESTSSSTQYTGYASFEADDHVRLGMSVTLTTIDE